MKKFDFLSLDGRSLRTFLVVLDERSISRAAAQLGVTQSAVSHLLDKLRLILGDPLFVRAGRGISPTERAIALREPIQAVLDSMKTLTDERPFDPAVGSMQFTVAANDFQRDLIFPGLLRTLDSEAIDISFRFIPSGIPATDLLRRARCQLIVTPLPPEGPDIYQVRLFEDQVRCFFDPENLRRSLPTELPKARIEVPNFSALAAFLKGTELISAQLSLLGSVNLQGLGSAPLPFRTRKTTMYMAWHKRDHLDPAHKWLRARIREQVAATL